MDYLSATIRLSGDVRWTVTRHNLSVPEIVILQYLHGADAVTNLELTLTGVTVDAQAEYERLGRLYKLPVVATVFPGARPDLPQDAVRALGVTPPADAKVRRGAPKKGEAAVNKPRQQTPAEGAARREATADAFDSAAAG